MFGHNACCVMMSVLSAVKESPNNFRVRRSLRMHVSVRAIHHHCFACTEAVESHICTACDVHVMCMCMGSDGKSNGGAEPED